MTLTKALLLLELASTAKPGQMIGEDRPTPVINDYILHGLVERPKDEDYWTVGANGVTMGHLVANYTPTDLLIARLVIDREIGDKINES